jgi:hypothetical protein
MKAHDVRHLTVCCFCDHIGDSRRMLTLPGHLKPAHDRCVVHQMTHDEILALPADERSKITLGAAGIDLMRKLMDAAGVKGGGNGQA